MSRLSMFPTPVRPRSTRRYAGHLPHCPVADGDMVVLLRRIQDGVGNAGCRVIEVTAAAHGDGVSTVVRGLARVASAKAGLRVLICDVSPAQSALDELQPDQDLMTLADAATTGAELERTIYWIRDTDIAVCALANEDSGTRMAVDVDTSRSLIAALRPRFDLILLDAPPVGESPVAPSLARVADGVVLVMAAEHTRLHAVAAARQQIEAGDGHILGVVFNKRRFHIPQPIYRLL